MTCPACGSTDTRKAEDGWQHCTACEFHWDGCERACLNCGRCSCVCEDEQ